MLHFIKIQTIKKNDWNCYQFSSYQCKDRDEGNNGNLDAAENTFNYKHSICLWENMFKYTVEASLCDHFGPDQEW